MSHAPLAGWKAARRSRTQVSTSLTWRVAATKAALLSWARSAVQMSMCCRWVQGSTSLPVRARQTRARAVRWVMEETAHGTAEHGGPLPAAGDI